MAPLDSAMGRQYGYPVYDRQPRLQKTRAHQTGIGILDHSQCSTARFLVDIGIRHPRKTKGP